MQSYSVVKVSHGSGCETKEWNRSVSRYHAASERERDRDSAALGEIRTHGSDTPQRLDLLGRRIEVGRDREAAARQALATTTNTIDQLEIDRLYEHEQLVFARPAGPSGTYGVAGLTDHALM